MVAPSAVCSRWIVYSTAKICLHFALRNSKSLQVHSGFSSRMATVYFSSCPLCEGTSQRLPSPLRVSLVLAAISKPLISLGSIGITSLSGDNFLSAYITIEYIDRPVKCVLDSNIFWCVYCLAWLNKLEKLLSIFASDASMNGFLVMLIRNPNR